MHFHNRQVFFILDNYSADGANHLFSQRNRCNTYTINGATIDEETRTLLNEYKLNIIQNAVPENDELSKYSIHCVNSYALCRFLKEQDMPYQKNNEYLPLTRYSDTIFMNFKAEK
jgi:hypothetical protein